MKPIFLLLLLMGVAPAFPATKGGASSARLQSRLKGEWRDAQGQGIRLRISPTAANGGVIHYWRGKSFYERSPYRVTGGNTLQVTQPKMAYRVRFTKAGMEWSLVGGRGKPRRFVRVRPSPPAKKRTA